MNPTTPPTQTPDEWIEEVIPLFAASTRLYNMNRDNHYAAKQGDRPPFTDEEIAAQKELIRDFIK